MRISLVLCVIVLVCHRADCTLTDFFNNLPIEIGNAFTNGWNSIVKAIKKPVRIKRLGRAKTTTTKTTSTTHHAPIEVVHRRVLTSTVKYELVHPSLMRLKLPILTTPKWQNLEQWKKLQRPMFVELKKWWGTSTTPEEVDDNDIGGDQNPSRLDDEDALETIKQKYNKAGDMSF